MYVKEGLTAKRILEYENINIETIAYKLPYQQENGVKCLLTGYHIKTTRQHFYEIK